jgi:hypothetical protein
LLQEVKKQHTITVAAIKLPKKLIDAFWEIKPVFVFMIGRF